MQLTGRLTALHGTSAEFADDLADTMGTAQARLDRVLGEIDRYADTLPGRSGAGSTAGPLRTGRLRPLWTLERAGVTGVVWATGFRPWYPWLQVPVLDPDGQIRHRRGVTDVPGLYAIGLRFQHRRNSTFVDGARHDAAYLADHLLANRRDADRRTEWTTMTSSSSVLGPAAPRRRCCWPGKDCRYCWSIATGTAQTPSPPMRSCAAACTCCPNGACSTASSTPALHPYARPDSTMALTTLAPTA